MKSKFLTHNWHTETDVWQVGRRGDMTAYNYKFTCKDCKLVVYSNFEAELQRYRHMETCEEILIKGILT